MTKLTGVTITGADESTPMLDLIALSLEFPFVEWGLLLGRGLYRDSQIGDGEERFPSHEWIGKFVSLAGAASPKARYALHLCGAYVRDLARGLNPVTTDLIDPVIIANAARLQFNFHGRYHEIARWPLISTLYQLNSRYIFQLDGANNAAFHFIRRYGTRLSIEGLYDRSGGRGVIPHSWPTPVDAGRYGYAGGLGPHTIDEEWPKIAAAAGDRAVWIDFETHARTKDDRALDFDAIRAMLEWAAPRITRGDA